METQKWSFYGAKGARFLSFPIRVTQFPSSPSTQACPVGRSLQTADLLWKDENLSRGLRGRGAPRCRIPGADRGN